MRKEIRRFLITFDPMIKILSIFLSIYIFVCTAILPKGDFSFTSQLSKLYDAFVQINGSTSLDEFLEEELLDPEYSPWGCKWTQWWTIRKRMSSCTNQFDIGQRKHLIFHSISCNGDSNWNQLRLSPIFLIPRITQILTLNQCSHPPRLLPLS